MEAIDKHLEKDMNKVLLQKSKPIHCHGLNEDVNKNITV